MLTEIKQRNQLQHSSSQSISQQHRWTDTQTHRHTHAHTNRSQVKSCYWSRARTATYTHYSDRRIEGNVLLILFHIWQWLAYCVGVISLSLHLQWLSVCVSVTRCVCLSICLSVCLSICLSVYLLFNTIVAKSCIAWSPRLFSVYWYALSKRLFLQ